MTNIISEIPRGSDILVQFNITDEDQQPVLLEDYEGITVYLYQCSNKKILAKYSKVEEVGYSEISIIESSEGTIQIYIPRSLTAKLKKDELRAEIKLRRVDADGEDGMMYFIISNIVVDFMTDSVSSSLIVP